MDAYGFLLAIALSLLAWIIYKRIQLFKKMAPGPYGIPILGTMTHLLKHNAIEEFQKYKKKYGKVFSLSLGNFYVTVVTDYRLIIDNMKKEEFQGRPEFEAWERRNGGRKNRGILFCDGPVWHEQRRFALRSLRDFGFGKESMEGMLINELQELQSTLRNDLGQPVNLSGVFNANVQNAPIASPGFFFFGAVKFQLIRRDQIKRNRMFRDEIRKLLDSVIDEHLENYKEGDIRDFIDAYIQQIKESSSSSSFHSEEGRWNLYTVLLDLFVAGAETTSTTLQWAMLYLSHHPHVQKKAQEEIDTIIGKSRPPSRADKPKLVYLEAVLNEVHRMCSLVPMSVYHRASQDSQIGGHFIPQNSVVMFSIYDAHHDEEVWGDPEKFRPERFLDTTGTKVVKHEALIPFSSGKRQCLGETLARDTLFVFLSGLLQAFTFEIDPESRDNDLKGNPSFISSPKPFKVIIKERM